VYKSGTKCFWSHCIYGEPNKKIFDLEINNEKQYIKVIRDSNNLINKITYSNKDNCEITLIVKKNIFPGSIADLTVKMTDGSSVTISRFISTVFLSQNLPAPIVYCINNYYYAGILNDTEGAKLNFKEILEKIRQKYPNFESKVDPFFLYLDKIWQKTGIPENLRPVIIWAEWQDRINKSKRR